MKAIVLFRFHGHFATCRERLRIIRSLNPGLPVFGLYGGPHVARHHAAETLGDLLDDLWTTRSEDTRWKWQHQDQAVREWFIECGAALDFDCVYDYEYDLLIAAPLASLLPAATGRVVALSGVVPLAEVASTWYWTSVEPFAAGARRHGAFLRTHAGVPVQTYASQGPFPVLSRAFLEAMARFDYPTDILAHVNCELTYPGMAQALGFDIVDTGLHPGWQHARPGRPSSLLFHCEPHPLVDFGQIAAELSRPGGRLAFHPVKECVHAAELLPLLGSPAAGPCAEHTMQLSDD